MNTHASQLSLFTESTTTESDGAIQRVSMPCARELTTRLAETAVACLSQNPGTRLRLIGPNRRSRDTLAATVEQVLSQHAVSVTEPITRQTWAAFCFEWLQSIASSWVVPQAMQTPPTRVMMLREADVLALVAQRSQGQPAPLDTLGQSPKFVHQLLDWCAHDLLGTQPDDLSLFEDPVLAQWARAFLHECLSRRTLAYGWLSPLLQRQLQQHPELGARMTQRIDTLIVDDAHQLGEQEHACVALIQQLGMSVTLGSHSLTDEPVTTPTWFGVFDSPEDERDTLCRTLLTQPKMTQPKPWSTTTVVCWDAESVQDWVDALSRHGIPCVGAMVAVGAAMVIEQSRLAVTWLTLNKRLTPVQRDWLHALWQTHAEGIPSLVWDKSMQETMNAVWTLANDWLSLSIDPTVIRFVGALARWQQQESPEETASAQQRWAQWQKQCVSSPSLKDALAPLLAVSERYEATQSLSQSLELLLPRESDDEHQNRAVSAMLKRVERWEGLMRTFQATSVPTLAIAVFDHFWQPASLTVQGADWNPLDTQDDELGEYLELEQDGVQLLLPEALWGHRNHRVIVPALTLANDRDPLHYQGILSRATDERWLSTHTHIEGRPEPVSATFIDTLGQAIAPWVSLESSEEPVFTAKPSPQSAIELEQAAIRRALPRFCRKAETFERAVGSLKWAVSASTQPPYWLTRQTEVDDSNADLTASLWQRLANQHELAEPILGEYEPLHLSATSLDSYANCPRQFYYRHMLSIKTPAGPQAVHGIWVHRILENFHRACEQQRLTMTAQDLSHLSQRVLVPASDSLDATRSQLQALGFKDEELDRLWTLPVLIRQDWLTHMQHVIDDWARTGWFQQPIRQVRAEFGFSDRPLVGVDNALFTGKIDTLLQYESGQWHVVDYKVYGHSKFAQTKDETRRQKLIDSYGKTVADANVPHSERFPTGITERSYQIPLYYMAMESVDPTLFQALQTVSLQIIRPSLPGSPQLGPITVSLDKTELDTMLPHMRAVIQEAFVNAIRQTTHAETNTNACQYCSFTAMCDAAVDPEASEGGEETFG